MFEVFVMSLFNTAALSNGSFLAFFRFLPIVLYIIALVGIFKLPKLHPIVFIICGAVLGIVFGL